MAVKRRWRYQPDEQPKKKHGWHKAEAGFVEVAGAPVGKCPNTISNEEAERLLNAGIEVRPSRSQAAYPERIYVIHNGVLYRAVPTIRGESYHGFPERAVDFQRLPGKVKRQILAHAKRTNQLRALRKWLS